MVAHQVRAEELACRDPNNLLDGINDPPPTPPPHPVLVSSSVNEWGATERIYEHVTDTWIDGGGFAGRTKVFALTTPPGWDGASQLPMMVVLHGGCNDYTEALGLMPEEHSMFVLYLDDGNEQPAGAGCSIPGKVHHLGYMTDHSPTVTGVHSGEIFVDYTSRRYLWTLDQAAWLVPVDTGAVFVRGHSKGAAGTLLMATRQPERFAGAIADVPAPSVTPAPPSENQSCDNYGEPWVDALDTGAALRDHPEARDVWYQVRLGKDDAAALWEWFAVPSQNFPEMSWLDAFGAYRMGHYVVWDEGGHDGWRHGLFDKAGQLDPILGFYWFDTGFNPALDPLSSLRSDRSFPAFSNFSANGDYGDGPPGCDSACRGLDSIPGDNAFSGDLAGALNRYLRWIAASIKDFPSRWAISVQMIDRRGVPGPEGSTCDSPPAGYPACFDDYVGTGLETVDITPRRRQSFLPPPGTTLRWRTSAGQSGQVVVDAEGLFTIPQVELTPNALVRLSVRRAP
jgi:pimeloyl-ACP methyl ester carboxylesterase